VEAPDPAALGASCQTADRRVALQQPARSRPNTHATANPRARFVSTRGLSEAHFHWPNSRFQASLYAELRLVTDDSTGERFLVQPSPTAQLPRHHASLKALMWVGIIVATLWVVVYLLTPYT
jgi:hypothetical protein